MTQDGMKAIREIALQIGHAAGDAVLVGGQSVLFWADIYKITPSGDIPALTEDVDFVASMTDIADAENAISALYSVDLRLASMDETSPNSGKMTIHHPKAGKINVDFLRMITGLDSGEVVDNAVTLSIDGVTFKIISPINLLKSKVSNLGAHLNKRNKEGVEQARLAVLIAEQYMMAKLADPDKKPPYQDFEKIIRLSMSDAALYANKYFGIDPMAAIPLDKLSDLDQFKIKRYSVAMNQIQIKRDKFDELIERMARYDNNATSSRFQP